MVSWNLINRNVWPIGLDIGHSSINMVQFCGRDSTITVQAAEKSYIDTDDLTSADEDIISAVKTMLCEGGFSGRKVVTALPSEKLHITSLRLAPMDEIETRETLKKEARERFGLNPELDYIDYLNVGQVAHGDEVKNELILFAAGDEAIREHISFVERMGLVPVGIDPIPCALFRSFTRLLRRQEDREQTVVFIDIGSRFTTVVFGRSGQISFIKTIPIGTDKFDNRICEKLGITLQEAKLLRNELRLSQTNRNVSVSANSISSPTTVQQEIDLSTRQAIVDAMESVSQELAREISLCFRYYTVTFRGKRVEKAFFSGGGAYENILLNVFRRQLAVDIEMAEPFRGFDMARVNFDSDRRAPLCEWTIAVGLALKFVPV